MDEIVTIICDFYKIEPSLIYSKKRNKELVKVRFICWYFIRKNTATSLQAIGNRFSKRTHHSVMHGIEQVGFQKEMYEDYRAEMRRVWIYLEHSLNSVFYEHKVEIYKNVILALIEHDPVLFSKLNLDEEMRVLIYQDLKIDEETIKIIEDVQESKMSMWRRVQED